MTGISHIGKLIFAGTFALAMSAAAKSAQAAPFSLTSSAFQDGGMSAVKNAGDNKAEVNCIGQNVSPPMQWSNAPAGTKSFALLMVSRKAAMGWA